MTLTTDINGRVPGHFSGRRGSGSLAAARSGVQATFAVVSFRGKVWRIKWRGDDEIIKGHRGQPRQDLEVVIVGASPAISKNYYAKAFVEGDDAAPDCFSLDGVKPDAAATNKQNAVCATCPHNQWGSRITDAGKKAKSCQDSRRITIVPLGDIPNEAFGGPMLLRLPPTTLPGFARYAELLERKGVGDMAWVGTRLSFDPEAAHPRIMFEPISYVTEEQDEQIAEIMRSPQIERILYDAGGASAAAEPEAPIPGTPPKAKRTALASPPPPAASDPPEEDEDLEEEEPVEEEEVEEDEDEEEEPPPPPAPAARRAKATPFAAPATPAAEPPKGRAKAAAAARAAAAPKVVKAPAAAPSDLEGAIEDLLDQP